MRFIYFSIHYTFKCENYNFLQPGGAKNNNNPTYAITNFHWVFFVCLELCIVFCTEQVFFGVCLFLFRENNPFRLKVDYYLGFLYQFQLTNFSSVFDNHYTFQCRIDLRITIGSQLSTWPCLPLFKKLFCCIRIFTVSIKTVQKNDTNSMAIFKETH